MKTVQSASQQSVEIAQIRLPRGGGALQSVTETFQASPFTGGGQFSVPLDLPESRGLNPSLSLNYQAGGGQGLFGLGFQLTVPEISRRLEKRLPTYSDEDDEFVLAGTEYLVPVLKQGDDWKLDQEIREDSQDPVNPRYQIRRYRPRTESQFLSIERWTSSTDRSVHWRVMTPDGLTHIYGRSSSAQIIHPDDPQQVFRWLLELTYDTLGNQIAYHYRPEDNQGIPATLAEQNRTVPVQKYLDKIQYGNIIAGQEKPGSRWAFSIVFDYGNYGVSERLEQLDNQSTLVNFGELSTTATQPWQARPDPFSDYRPGFDLRTQRLCHNILVFHHFEELPVDDCLVAAWRLLYDTSGAMSLMAQVQRFGFRLQADGRYEVSALPPISFDYSRFAPDEQVSFQPLTVEDRGRLANQFDLFGYQLLDLYGEGIAGVLYDRQGAPLYWRSRGDGNFEQPAVVANYPIEQQARETLYEVQDGQQPRVVVRTPARAGFYALQSDDTWQSWRTFAGVALERFNPTAELTDVTGNGFPDVLLFEDERVKVYPDARAAGDLDGLTANRRVDLPRVQTAAPNEAVLLADMSGDGLSDRVRIRGGSVTYWPNLGYGRFGAPVSMDNAPLLDDRLDPSRLFLADVDGSGTQDLIYVNSDTVQLYINEGGNRFANPITVRLPHRYHPEAEIQLADILGNGTTCFVFSYGTQEIHHRFYNFAGASKPYLLTEINNHRGALTRVRYAPSTKFYLEDRRLGQPWVTKLPFPLQVVERIERVDLIARSKQVMRYAYHHGAYDLREREFAGFGLVEQWDSEAFEQFAESDLTEAEAFELPPDELHTPPIHRKTWYHNGLAEREQPTLSRQFAAEYYTGDVDAINLADSHFEASPTDSQSWQAAYRALRGRILREEVYADQDKHPYTVQETAYQLRLVQPMGDTPERSVHYAPRLRASVYLPLERETIQYSYDLTPQETSNEASNETSEKTPNQTSQESPNEPRIRHRLSLGYDTYGNLTRQAELAYARRQPANPQQGRTQATYRVRSFKNLVDRQRGLYRLGLVTEQQTFELGVNDWQPDSENWQRLTALTSDLTAVEHDQSLPSVGGRLVAWQRYRYWNDSLTEMLSVGEASFRGLVARVETATAAIRAIANLFSDFTSATVHRKLISADPDGGAFITDTRTATGQTYYFDPGITAYYGSKDDFYQPVRYVDQFGTVTRITHDAYRLRIVSTATQLSETESLVETAKLDYLAMQPAQVLDVNTNVTDYRYDPLQQIRWSSRYGTETTAAEVIEQGDDPLAPEPAWTFPTLAEVIAEPATFLQQATSLTIYDLRAWERSGQPATTLTVTRDRYSRDPDETGAVQISIEYADGFGRSVQQKRRAEGGEALRVRGDNTVVTTQAAIRWITTGRTVYNNKGAVIRQYEPFYADSPRYQPEAALTSHGVSTVNYYDPLGRLVRLAYPKGYATLIEYRPWQVRRFDANDTILHSTYYSERIAAYGDYQANPLSVSAADRDSLNALGKALAHADTPTVDQLDVWGRTVTVLEQDRQGKDLPRLKSTVNLDILGNQQQQQSPRWAGSDKFDFETVYDLQGRPLRRIGLDNGSRWTLYNAGGDLIHRWDERGVHTATHYDALSRPVGIWTDRPGQTPQQVEKIEYGETLDPDGDFNLRGQVAHRYDGAGRLTYRHYGLNGNWLQCDRTLRATYDQEPNWAATGNRTERLTETYTITRQFDALSRPVTITDPNGRQVKRTYHPSGRLQSLTLKDNGTQRPLIEEVTYNARNQRLQVFYGNGTTTTYGYDPLTFELLTLQTQRDGHILQDLYYTYDPVGNVTRLRDLGQNTVFTNNQAVKPQFDYTYDALYRLIAGSGREHPALYNNRPADELPDYGQLFDLNFDLNNSQALDRYTRHYSYDLAGNLTQIEHRASRNEFTRINQIDGDSNRLGGMDYDGSGNPEALEHLRALRWNSRNQLASADVIQRQGAPNDAEYYAYDAAGQRVRKTSETLINQQNRVLEVVDTLYFENYQIQRIRRGNRVLQERNSLTVREQELLVAVALAWPVKRRNDLPNRQLRFQLGDRQGSVSLELDANGQIINYEEYYPFGGTALVAGRSQREVDHKLYRYSRRERDDVTQLYCYGSRYYVPWQGRWLSPDLAGTVDGLNLFIFVRNNPLRYEDDGGFKSKPIKVTVDVPVDKTKFPHLAFFEATRANQLPASDNHRRSLSDAPRPRGGSGPRRNSDAGRGRRRSASNGALGNGGNPQAQAATPNPAVNNGNAPNAPNAPQNAPDAQNDGGRGGSVGTSDRDTLILIATALVVALMLALQIINNELVKAGKNPADSFNLKVLDPDEKDAFLKSAQQNQGDDVDDDAEDDSLDDDLEVQVDDNEFLEDRLADFDDEDAEDGSLDDDLEVQVDDNEFLEDRLADFDDDALNNELDDNLSPVDNNADPQRRHSLSG